jgi:hypothetical protein
MSSQHILCIITEEVLEGTHGCCIAVSDTARSRFDLYRKHPIKILDQKDCVTRHTTVKFFKDQWSNHYEE